MDARTVQVIGADPSFQKLGRWPNQKWVAKAALTIVSVQWKTNFKFPD